MVRHGVSTAWQLAAAAALLATLSAITLVSHSRQAASELLMVVPGAPQLWLGEHWYIDGLKDDGNYMVPAVSDKETGDSSGNALFDFGRGAGTPLSKTAGEPIPGLLPKQYWRKTGTSEPHFPNSIRQFDINGIRELEDGVIPTWQRADYYDDTYPKYREDYGFIEGPQVSINDGHVGTIEDSTMSFYDTTSSMSRTPGY